MPLVRKRARSSSPTYSRQKRQRIVHHIQHSSKSYQEFGNIGYKDDHWHTLYRSIPESLDELYKVLCKHIGSFLNGRGGILCFGVRRSGVIYGDHISRKEEDNIKLSIDEVFKKFHPHVPPSKYRVSFTPVLSRMHQTSQSILEIRVSPGSENEMYEDLNHEVFLRKDSDAYGPLTPHEIKRHTVQQIRKKLKSQQELAKQLEKPSYIVIH